MMRGDDQASGRSGRAVLERGPFGQAARLVAAGRSVRHEVVIGQRLAVLPSAEEQQWSVRLCLVSTPLRNYTRLFGVWRIAISGLRAIGGDRCFCPVFLSPR